MGAGTVSKHINMDYVYVQPILDESANVNPDNFRTAMFTNPTWNISYATAPKRHAVDNSDFALKPSKPGFDVVDYNTTDKPAFKGTEVQTRTVGLVPNTPYTIQWYNAAGEKVGTTCKLDSDDLGAVPSCPFTVPDTAKAGDVFTAVVELPDGTPFLADSFIVKEPMTDSMDPKYDDKLVVPGEETKSSPTFTDKDGQKVDAPKDAKFSIPEDFKAPEGYEVKIDENTGEVTVTFPDKSKLNKDTAEEFSVPVTVTYPDGTKDDAKANFKLDTDGDGDPDVTDPDDDGDGIPDEDDSNPKVPNANDHFDPVYEDGSGKPGSDVKIDPPTFKDKDGNETKAPEGTKFTPGENAPEGVTIDEKTGAITVPVPEDAKPGDKITVPVVVTYPDGTKDNVDVTVTVTEKDNGVYEPAYEDKLVVPGKETKSSPTFTDKEGKDAKAPEGSKFTIGEDFTVPEGYEVKIDESNGEITVTVDGDKLNKDTVEDFDVPVTVTYPDGSTDKTDANFKLDTDNDGKPDTEDDDDDNDGIPDEVEKEKGSNPKDKGSIPATPIEPGNPTNAATYEPGYEDGSGKPGSDVKIEAPKFTDKDGNDTKAPEGTKFTPGENVPDGVTIDENTGEITVTIPEDATPGDKITVPVEVTYPDGSKDNVDVTITVEQPDAVDPQKYPEDTEVEQGGSEKITPTTDVPEGHTPKLVGQDGKPTDKVVVEDENGKITVEIDENGVITVTTDEKATPGDYKVPVVNVDENGHPIEGTEQQVPVKVTEKGDQGDEGNNTGDDAVKYTPTWKNAKTKPAVPVDVKNERPDQLPEGSKVEAQSDKGWTVTTAPDGTITVTPPADAQHGDKSEISVTVTYPDGSQDRETFTVTVETDPSWEDGKTTPDKPIVIPNDGGPVKPGTTVEVVDNGPGTVEIDENGNITVTPTDEAEPGDTVVVVVKDPEGNEIDRVTVEIVENPEEVTPTDPNDEPKGNQADDVTPDWENETVKPGGSVEVPNKGDKLPDGSKIETEVSKDGWTVEADPKTGELKVTAPKDAKHGDKVTVTVTVTYPDGSTDTEKFTVTVVEKKDGSTPPGSSGSSDLPDGLIPGLIGGGIIGGLIGSHLGSSHGSSTPGQGTGSGHGSSTPGHGAGKAPADKGAQQGAGNQGGNAGGQSGKVGPLGGKSGAAQSGASSSSTDRQGSLAVTGVSGVAIMLGAAAMALAIGGALLAGRRRREN
ncbi:YPDG domain-containing protein [Corynebacterium sp. UMB4614]|uniref:YPDG domain-containing protein n=1 Tax=Corynebacterium sp. UMB4614 TaxID=3046334 RepID=UPI00254D660D|nr:YPDG domain-containing protein [Corynebacterium sp. UMB4614]MDK7135524.1 YPDG domain-containing protein [Corynebacterium sp. UMB4614]